MAKQAGPLPFTGSIGGVTGYKRNGKYCLKEKSGPSREMVLTSPRFARTLENAKEFRRAVRAGKLVRGCLHNLAKGMKLADKNISGRLNGLLTKVVKSDPVSDRGERTVSKGQLEWLEDFAFQKEKAFCSVFMACPASTMNTDTGNMKVDIRPFDPQQGIESPEAATHFKVVSNCAAIDFDKERTDWSHKETGFLSLSEYIEETIILEQTLQPRPGQALLQAIGIAFYRQAADGHFERVPGGVMRIVQVSEPRSRQVGTSFNGIERKEMQRENPSVDAKCCSPDCFETEVADRTKTVSNPLVEPMQPFVESPAAKYHFSLPLIHVSKGFGNRSYCSMVDSACLPVNSDVQIWYPAAHSLCGHRFFALPEYLLPAPLLDISAVG